MKSGMRILQTCLLACLVGEGKGTAAQVIVDLMLRTKPENVAMYQGDTIVLRGALSPFSCARGLSEPWQTPRLPPGERFELQFLQPGTQIYLAGDCYSEFPASIQVQPLTDSRPAISLVSPPDGFAVPGYGLLQAAVTNAEAAIQMVQFFDRGRLLGVATNTPYRLEFSHRGDLSTEPPTYVFTAKAINKDGSTNESPPIVVRDHPALVFDPILLPGGQVAFFFSMQPIPNCVERTSDFVNWIRLGRKGNSTFFDDYQTNAPVRAYRMRVCL
jgi:hypothetical protein